MIAKNYIAPPTRKKEIKYYGTTLENRLGLELLVDLSAPLYNNVTLFLSFFMGSTDIEVLMMGRHTKK